MSPFYKNSGLETTPTSIEDQHTFYNFYIGICILTYVIIYETLDTLPKESRGLDGMYMPISNIITPDIFRYL